jgi:hypothetical protein
MVFPPDPSLVAEIDMRDRTMEVLTELIDLNRILLNLAPSREFPAGSPRHGYDFIAPLDAQGHIDPILWKKYRHYCRVRRFGRARMTRSVISSKSPVAPNKAAMIKDVMVRLDGTSADDVRLASAN